MKNVKTGDDGAEREAIVAWLRKDARLCDCFAYDESECCCGAWLTEPGERSYKTAYIEDLADAIERGEHLAVRSHIIGEDK